MSVKTKSRINFLTSSHETFSDKLQLIHAVCYLIEEIPKNKQSNESSTLIEKKVVQCHKVVTLGDPKSSKARNDT